LSPTEILKQYWGYDAFRPLQKDVVDSIISNDKVLGILPTGAGKSICYQVPVLHLNKKAIVISPLISLIEDQINNLQKRGIACINLSGPMGFRDVERLLGNFQAGPHLFLFCSPERLQSKLFKEFLPYLPYEILVVDEAHCVSDWGDYFRPTYRSILSSLELNPPKKTIALTASAPPVVRQHILQYLDIHKSQIISGKIRRPNIHLKVVPTETPEIPCAEELNSKGSIVYAHFRNKSERFAAFLNAKGKVAKAFHGGMTTASRASILEEWLQESIDTVVATSAFGMGIDKPNVRQVFHINMPASLEHYYQESGRAGRDGELSEAVFFFNDEMVDQDREIAKNSWPDPELLERVYQKTCSLHQVAYNDLSEYFQDFKWPMLSSFFEADKKVRKALEVLEKYGFISFHLSKRDSIQWKETDIHALPLEELTPSAEAYLRSHTHIEPLKITPVPAALKKTDLETLSKLNFIHFLAKGSVTISFPKQRPKNIFSFFPKQDYLKGIKRKLSQKSWMHYFLHTQQCLWQVLELYFGEKPGKPCGHCTNCKKGLISDVPYINEEYIETHIKTMEEFTLFEPLIRYSKNQE